MGRKLTLEKVEACVLKTEQPRIRGKATNTMLQFLLVAASQYPDISSVLKPTPIDDPALAASPQRELFRVWDDCLNEGKLIGGLSASASEVMQFAFKACEEHESRLTGQLVREFGYNRATAIIKTAKSKMSSAFTKSITVSPEKSSSDPRPVAKSGPWEIYAFTDHCLAINLENIIPWFPATVVATDGTSVLVTFQFQTDKRDAAQLFSGRTANLSLTSNEGGHLYKTSPMAFIFNYRSSMGMMEAKHHSSLEDLKRFFGLGTVTLELVDTGKSLGPVLPLGGLREAVPSLLACSKEIKRPT
jgi:hypothetical protein